MRPLLYTCVVCEHFYHCGASCFPRVMLQRATFFEGVHCGQGASIKDPKQPPPCPSLIFSPAYKAGEMLQTHMHSTAHAEAVRAVRRYPAIAAELDEYREGLQKYQTKQLAAFEQRAAERLRKVLADPSSRVLAIEPLNLMQISAPPERLWPPVDSSYGHADVIGAVLRGENVHRILPRFVKIAGLEDAAKVPIVGKRPLLSNEEPAFLTLGAPQMLGPTQELRFILDQLDKPFERDWCSCLLSSIHTVIIRYPAACNEHKISQKLKLLFPQSETYCRRPEEGSRYREAVLQFDSEKEAIACIRSCESKKRWRATRFGAVKTLQDADSLPILKMREELTRYAVYTFRLGEHCTAEVILHRQAVRASAYQGSE